MNKKYLAIKQNDFIYYCINLSVDELLNIYTIEFFNSEREEGYQRFPKKSHYMKLVKYLMEEEKPILIPSIIAAINYKNVGIESNYIKINDKIRIVDGQHRIEAFKYIRNNYPEKYEYLKEQEFLVELIVIYEDQKYIEISTFIDINSKNKKVDLDLAIQLKHKLINKDIVEKVDNDFYSTEILNNLNKDENSVWFNLIKVGNDLDKKIVSSKAFQRSIKNIVEEVSEEKLSNYEIIVKCVNIINDSWNIIKNKWPNCFKDPFNYNIQKGIGVFPFHMIISEIINNLYKQEGNINPKSVESEFQKIINNTQIIDSNWLIGETFSKYNSKAGFNYIKEIIQNKKLL